MMPQCKMSGCREQAVPGGRKWGSKRYCKAHGEAYHRKQVEHAAIARTLPDCESHIAPDCAGKVSPTRVAAGKTICAQCEALGDHLDARYIEEQRKRFQLDTAQDVESLKEWIRKYLF